KSIDDARTQSDCEQSEILLSRPLVFGLTFDGLRAWQNPETQAWGTAFATLGIAGTLAMYFSASLKRG
ncbi:MAG: hypothetical protein ACR2PG_00575, partial [Hyphomicrobiaceae bacterium]